MNIKRCGFDEHQWMVNDDKGEYVRYESHQEVVSALEAKCAALAAELEDAEKRIAEQNKTLMAARSYVKSHAAGDGHAFCVLQAIDRSAGIGVKGE